MIKPFLTAACLIILLLGEAAQADGNPWFGTWKLKLNDPTDKPETLIYSDGGGGAMRMVSVEQHSVIVTRFDGTQAADIGAGARKGNGLAIKATSRTSYDWTFFMDGKPYVQGQNTLAADLKTFNEVSWLVSKPGDLITLVYERR